MKPRQLNLLIQMRFASQVKARAKSVLQCPSHCRIAFDRWYIKPPGGTCDPVDQTLFRSDDHNITRRAGIYQRFGARPRPSRRYSIRHSRAPRQTATPAPSVLRSANATIAARRSSGRASNCTCSRMPSRMPMIRLSLAVSLESVSESLLVIVLGGNSQVASAWRLASFAQ